MRNSAKSYSSFPATSSRLLRVLSVLICCFLIVGCDRYKTKPLCSDDTTPSNLRSFTLNASGTAFDMRTGLNWYRCLAGLSFSNGRCQGIPLRMSWGEAKRFAADLSEKSGIVWRLATKQQLQNLIQPDCNGPALNTAVFHNIGAVNLWTESSSWKHRKDYACTVYAYNGALSCKQSKATAYSFLLVTEQDPSNH